uniref:Thiaminase I, tandem duplicate 1 n=1 Tax=Oryzias sinensis TaxID=183150 RepID=A0A8C7Y144_9TELE
MRVPVCWMLLCLFCLSSGTGLKSKIIRAADVYEELWNKNLNVAKGILKLTFLQKMEKGKLSQDAFNNFMKQDIYYVGQVTNMLKKLSETPGELQDFFKNRYNSYDKFLHTLLHEYNLKDVSGIKPIPAIQKYIDDYREIMEKEEPIYFAVGLYPCARLWPFLANELKMDETNLYYKWKKDNMGGHYEENYKDLLNKHLQSEEEIERADKVFNQQILNEREFFKASGQRGVERRRQGVR